MEQMLNHAVLEHIHATLKNTCSIYKCFSSTHVSYLAIRINTTVSGEQDEIWRVQIIDSSLVIEDIRFSYHGRHGFVRVFNIEDPCFPNTVIAWIADEVKKPASSRYPQTDEA